VGAAAKSGNVSTRLQRSGYTIGSITINRANCNGRWVTRYVNFGLEQRRNKEMWKKNCNQVIEKTQRGTLLVVKKGI